MARLFSDDENAIIVKDDGTPVLIVGEDEEFSALDGVAFVLKPSLLFRGSSFFNSLYRFVFR